MCPSRLRLPWRKNCVLLSCRFSSSSVSLQSLLGIERMSSHLNWSPHGLYAVHGLYEAVRRPLATNTLRSGYEHLYLTARETKAQRCCRPARGHTANTRGARKWARPSDFGECFLSHKGPRFVGFHLYDVYRRAKSIETETRLVVSGDWEAGEQCLRGTGFLFGVMKRV